jgi:hypothetical protein
VGYSSDRVRLRLDVGGNLETGKWEPTEISRAGALALD